MLWVVWCGEWEHVGFPEASETELWGFRASLPLRHDDINTHLNEKEELDEPYFVKFPYDTAPKAHQSSALAGTGGYLITLENTALMFFPFSEKLRSYSVTTLSAAYSLA